MLRLPQDKSELRFLAVSVITFVSHFPASCLCPAHVAVTSDVGLPASNTGNTGLGVTWDGGWNTTTYQEPLMANLIPPTGFTGPEFLFPIAPSKKYKGILCDVGSF